MKSIHPLVYCSSCNFTTNRKIKDNGSFGHCPKCGYELRLSVRKLNKQLIKARTEIQELENEHRNS